MWSLCCSDHITLTASIKINLLNTCEEENSQNIIFCLTFPMLHMFMHRIFPASFFLHICSTVYTVCCANVSPHLLFEWFLRADVPPSVLSSSFTSISFYTNNRLLFSCPLDLRKKFHHYRCLLLSPHPKILSKDL